MKYLFLLLTALFSIKVIAQQTKPVTPAYAIIKGHIKNHTLDLWDYSETTYLDFKTSSVPVDKNGDFLKRIKINEQYRNIYFPDGEGMVIDLQKGDTINYSFDQQDINNTIAIHASQANRDKEIQTFIALRKLQTNGYDQVREVFINKKLTDTAKFLKINHLYNKEIELLLAGGLQHNYVNKVPDIYFHYARYLLILNLLPAFRLYTEHPTEMTKNIDLLENPTAYTKECFAWYRNSSEYRDFIFDYVRFNSALNSWEGEGRATVSNNFAGYYDGRANFHFVEIRDWFVTKTIMFNFQYSPFTEAAATYNKFADKVETPKYADTLKQFYVNVQRLKPGVPAPGFILKDDNGKQVSLAQLKGKVVYIDFWGVGCGPCISDIKTEVPALHQKYKGKNIVFVNVCVDSDESTWKESIKKLNLDGLNLIAEGWTKNPMCKAYNVNGIPHYFLIDTNGKIADNNSAGPGEKEMLYDRLDKLLK